MDHGGATTGGRCGGGDRMLLLLFRFTADSIAGGAGPRASGSAGRRRWWTVG